MGGAGQLDQLDGLVDGGVVGCRVGEQELEKAEPQAGQHRRVEQSRRALGEALDRRVAGPAPLHGPIGEALRLSPLAAAEAALAGPLAEGELGEGPLLERRPNRLEGDGPGHRHLAHSLGSG